MIHPSVQHPKELINKERQGLKKLGAVIGLRITNIVGTMTVALLFALLALISLPAALKTHDKIIIVAWVAQTFLQLVLLPIIIVGQNVIQAQNDAKAEVDHNTLTYLAKIQDEQLEILKELNKRRR